MRRQSHHNSGDLLAFSDHQGISDKNLTPCRVEETLALRADRISPRRHVAEREPALVVGFHGIGAEDAHGLAGGHRQAPRKLERDGSAFHRRARHRIDYLSLHGAAGLPEQEGERCYQAGE